MATRRTSRRTSRRLRSNARPIKVDTDLVNRLMSRIANSLYRFKRYAQSRAWSNNDPLLNFGGIDFLPTYINDFARLRRKILVSILLTHAPPRERGRFIDLRKEKDVASYAQGYDGLIEIYVYPHRSINGKQLDWSQLDSPEVLHDIQKTLTHELVHAQDFIGREKVRSALAPGATPSDLEQAAYLRTKAELRAFMRIIADDVEAYIKHLHELHEKQFWDMHFATHSGFESWDETPPPPKLSSGDIVDLIEVSPAWKQIRGSLSADGAKLILKGVITALEDRGLVSIS